MRTCHFEVIVIFFKNAEKITSGGLIQYLAWSHTLTFCKKYLCSKKHKFRINYIWTCDFYYINISWKKLKYGIKPNFSKYWIRPPHVIFSAFLKTITTARLSANFLSPDSNGQGYDLMCAQYTFFYILTYQVNQMKNFTNSLNKNPLFCKPSNFNKKSNPELEITYTSTYLRWGILDENSKYDFVYFYWVSVKLKVEIANLVRPFLQRSLT